uniref:FimV N-terminal domain-containing protein n=1 Tax=Candidatus Kentrum sp. TC TaxID=2126339 RepID=A0A450YY04_9GAMM|nr:MAG: FimV N-terminal domain-containing protein [Candidatus Kentron sp. TC]
MRKSILAFVLLSCVRATSVHALALTDINLSSGINEPLDARIPLRALQPTDMETLLVKLADAEHFVRANLERLPILDALQFKAVQDSDRSAHVRITTDNAINEPFLSFIVEVSWARGRILREYTLLLDPPMYTGAASTTVKEAEMSVDEEVADKITIPRTEKSSTTKIAPTASAIMLDENPDVFGASSSQYGPVIAEDTLWSIATRSRPDKSVSIEQMMLLLQQHNPNAFLDNNINALKVGAILRIPDRSKIATIPQKKALAEVKRQHAAWDEFRQRLAANPIATSSGSPVPSTETKSGSTETERSGRIEILSAGTEIEGIGQPGKDSAKKLHAEIALAKEEIDAKERENKELRSRIAEAEDLIQEFVHLMEIQSDEINALKRKLAETDTEIGSKAPPAEPQSVAPQLEASSVSRTIPKEEETQFYTSETEKILETIPGRDAQSSSSLISEPLSEIVVPTESSFEKNISELNSKWEGFSLLDRIRENLIIIVAGLGVTLILIAGRILWLRRRREIAEGNELDNTKEAFQSNEVMDLADEVENSTSLEQKKKISESKKPPLSGLDIIPNAKPDAEKIAGSSPAKWDSDSSGPDSFGTSPAKVTETKNTEGENIDLGFSFDLDLDPSRESSRQKSSKAQAPDFPPPDMFDDTIDEIQTRLDLAQAYIDMGDAEGARNILTQVLEKGSKAHKNLARELLEKLD